MPGFIPTDVLENIRSRIDIVDLISEYVQLKKKGRNYVGPCPFHQENDPSFTVSFEKQIFYCFGCGAGGDCIKFLMLYQGFTFQEAVQILAQRAGVALPVERGAAGARKKKQSELVYKLNQLAKDFFRHVLKNGVESASAREYLDKRGLAPETIEHFELGYAPSQWDALIKHFRRLGYDQELLVKHGLAVRGKKGVYDRFRSRIIFPIRNHAGYIVGFGGRILGEGEPKYLNTAETEFFSKSKLLYGFYEARRYIRESGHVVIMEGYMDVITAHQYGINNAVAALGTSLTRQQAEMVARYTRDVIIAFDADSAGIAATMRGLDLMQEAGCRVRVISIPDGKDPDEFLQRYGAEGWHQLVANAEPLLEYKIRQLKADVTDTAYAGKSIILEKILPNLASIKDEIEKAEAIKLVTARLQTTYDAVASELRSYIEKERKKRPNSDKIAKTKYNIIHNGPQLDARTKAEQVLLKLVLENPELIPTIKSELGTNFFSNDVLKKIFEQALSLIEQSTYSPAALLEILTENCREVVSKLLLQELPGDNPAEVLPPYLKAMKEFLRKEKRLILMDSLVEAEKAGNREAVSQILEKLKALY